MLRRHELDNYKIMELVGNFLVKLFSTIKCWFVKFFFFWRKGSISMDCLVLKCSGKKSSLP